MGKSTELDVIYGMGNDNGELISVRGAKTQLPVLKNLLAPGPRELRKILQWLCGKIRMTPS